MLTNRCFKAKQELVIPYDGGELFSICNGEGGLMLIHEKGFMLIAATCCTECIGQDPTEYDPWAS